MNFMSEQDCDLLELPVPVKRRPIGAKSLVSHTRRNREGIRAFSPGMAAPQQAISRLDERLVRLLKEISSCELDATLRDASNGAPTHVCRW